MHTASATTTAQVLNREARPSSNQVMEHLHLVQRVVRRLARRLPRCVATDDLMGAGTLGLIDAVNRYDHSRAASFQAYAEIRIRGAILDYLRVMDWLPRSTRATVKAGTSDAAVVSVEDVRDDGFDTFVAALPLPSSAVERSERKERLAQAIRQLPPRDRELLSLYYVEDLTLKQIGEVMKITESRVCQLHAAAVDRLRRQLADDVELA